MNANNTIMLAYWLIRIGTSCEKDFASSHSLAFNCYLQRSLQKQMHRSTFAHLQPVDRISNDFIKRALCVRVQVTRTICSSEA